MAMYGAGELNERIQILRRADKAAMSGGVLREQDFTVYLRRWAKVMRRPGGEQVEAGVPHDTRPAEVLVRADPETRTIGAGDRCVLERDNRTFEITNAVLDDRDFRMIRIVLSAAPMAANLRS